MILDLAFLADLPLTFSEVSSEKNTPVFIEMDPKKWLVFFVAQSGTAGQVRCRSSGHGLTKPLDSQGQS